MATEEKLSLLWHNVKAWNEWRKQNPDVEIDLSGALQSLANLKEADLSGVNLSGANLVKADLSGANLSGANLSGAFLCPADLKEANLAGANLREADLNRAYLEDANLSGTCLNRANLKEADLSGADLSQAQLNYACFVGAKLDGANLKGAYLRGANLTAAHIRGANLREADLSGADLTSTDFGGSDLSLANLDQCTAFFTNFTDSILKNCSVDGINVWRLSGIPHTSSRFELTVAEDGEEKFTVAINSLEIAQFVGLLLNQSEIANAIDTTGTKGVLILEHFLGDFTLGRENILEALWEKFGQLGFLTMSIALPDGFFEHFEGTVMDLARLSRFIVVDITNSKSCPVEELDQPLPNCLVPIAPIIQSGEEPIPEFANGQTTYAWIIEAVEYDDCDQLISAIEEKLVKPASEMADELNLRKAQARKPPVREYAGSSMSRTYWDLWKDLIVSWDWDKIEIEQEVMAVLIKESKSYSFVKVCAEIDDDWILDGYIKPNKRILVSKAVEFDAVEVILARNDVNHNHSGSAEEVAESKELEKLLAELDITLSDYMIVSKKGYGSLWFETGGE